MTADREYDAERDTWESWWLAISEIRRLVKKGEIELPAMFQPTPKAAS